MNPLGVLRITYEGRATAFEYSGLARRDVDGVLARHLDLFAREQVNGVGVTVPRALVRAAWTPYGADGSLSTDAVVTIPIPAEPARTPLPFG